MSERLFDLPDQPPRITPYFITEEQARQLADQLHDDGYYDEALNLFNTWVIGTEAKLYVLQPDNGFGFTDEGIII